MKDKATNWKSRVKSIGGLTQIYDKDDIFIGECSATNARLIVHRVNTYEEVVGALIDLVSDVALEVPKGEYMLRINKARQALLNAEKESV